MPTPFGELDALQRRSTFLRGVVDLPRAGIPAATAATEIFDRGTGTRLCSQAASV
jgi:hypothetical protein